ncbi:cytochrome P450 [Brooklawnia sp.]|uniref:cytochrome P450 n=1 Tax=Brooklawnia sp. TaxID=2699740 RepID=UPI00311E34DB
MTEPRAFADHYRREQPVVRDDQGRWILLSHADVVAAADDPDRFSSAVSAYLQIPNGLDGDAHRAARETIDRYFEPEGLIDFEPVFRHAAYDLIAGLPSDEAVEAVSEIGSLFAVRGQSAWLGWPPELETQLLEWMESNHAASRSGDRQQTGRVAEEFDAIISSVLDARRALGDDAPDDVTTRLMHDTIDGRALTDPELVSILRNWTGGDLGSIALCVGVIVGYLAEHPGLQQRLRSGVSEQEFDAILDEALRIDDPFVSNRRKTTCPVHIGDSEIPADSTVVLHWTSANRDEAVFGDADRFDPEDNAERNLVYGIGPHVCPGRPLATMELRILTQELLAATSAIELAPGETPERELAPVGGYRRMPVLLSKVQ